MYYDFTYFDYLINISDKIKSIFNIISSSIGIPCNILSIIIFARLMKNKNNMGFLYIWQCSIDLCILLFNLFILRSEFTLGVMVPYLNQSACKASTYVYRIFIHGSSWIAVLTAFDRFTFILYGHSNRFRFLKSKRKLTCVILAILTIITILDIPNYFYYIDIKHEFCSSDIIIYIVSNIISVLLRTHFPFSLMIIFNITMIRKIVKTRRNALNHSANSRKENQFTVAVITYDVVFFVLNAPISLYNMFYDINFISGHFKRNYAFHAKYVVISSVVTSLSLCEQTFSFFLYLAFNKLFRKELFYMMGRIFRFHIVSSQNTSQRS